ncbi:MAG: hypothetical protein Q4D42_13820 [Eubacteriales bacterium]|nr:hypothetical protein [Eubacteriales bacterium]
MKVNGIQGEALPGLLKRPGNSFSFPAAFLAKGRYSAQFLKFQLVWI